MKKVFKKILVLASIACAALCLGLFAACAQEPTGAKREEELLKQGYIRVTYDANGGDFGNGQQSIDSLVLNESKTPYPGYLDSNQKGIPEPTMSGYIILGWYPAELDENGNVVYESDNKTPVTSETAWNFTTDRVTESTVLVAKWRRDFKFLVQFLVPDGNGGYSVLMNNNGKPQDMKSYSVEKGTPLLNYLYKKDEVTGNTLVRPDNISVKSPKKYTAIEFYMDEELETPLDTSFVHPGDSQASVNIYAKCLKGDFEFITAESGENLKLSAASYWYFLEDVTIPASAEAWSALSSFTGAIYGNNHTLSGIRMKSDVNATKATDTKAHSLFGFMNGTVENLKIKDATVEVGEKCFGGNGEQYISFLASDFGRSGVFNNVSLENCSLKIFNKDDYPAITYETQKHYWRDSAGDEDQVGYIAKQNVAGTVNVTFVEAA